MSGTWQASAWFLERRFPDKWGKRTMVEQDLHLKGDISHNTTKTTR